MLGLMRRNAFESADAIAVDLRNVAAVIPEDTAANPLVGSDAGHPRTKLAAENGVS